MQAQAKQRHFKRPFGRFALLAAFVPALVLAGWWVSCREARRADAGAALKSGQTTTAAFTSKRTLPWGTSPELGDGKDSNSLRQWAHNELEYQRMLEENSRIKRRQLVALKETAAAVVERSRQTGQLVRQLTLPGLDGREILFEITQADLQPSGLQGRFAGHVAGRADSMVTLAFKNGVEAFTIVSPTDGLYLQAEPHNPGDVIVKEIDPETYAAGLCGTR